MIDDDYEGPDFTCITFSPDWKRFHMTGMEADTIALLRKVCTYHILVSPLFLPFAASVSGGSLVLALLKGFTRTLR